MSDDLSGFSLFDLFRTEAESCVSVLSSGLLSLEATGSSPGVIEPLMRAAHSLKGAARIVGLEPIEKVAHGMEDVFVAAQYGRIQLQPHNVDALLGCVDLLNDSSRMSEADLANWEETLGPRVNAAIEILKAIEAGTHAAPAGAPGPEPAPSPAPEPTAPEATAPPPAESPAEGRQAPAPRPRKRAAPKKPAAHSATAPPVEAKVAKPAPEPPKPAAEIPRPAPEPPPSPEPPKTAPARPARTPRPEPVEVKAAAVARARPEPQHAVNNEVEAVIAGSSQARASASPAEAMDRVVRVTADSLNRLMGLAGASLVEARQLRPIVDALDAVKNSQSDLWDRLQGLEDSLASRPDLNTNRERELLLKAKQQATRCLELLGERIIRLENHARRNEDLSERLHHEVISSRLRPLADGVRGFPRMVRDLGRQLGKKIRFELSGEQTGVDRDILEKLESPLTHLIRNAIDHAIEPPQEREARGKDPTGTIHLEARHVAGMLQITLSDNGRGIDTGMIRRRILERGLVGAAMAEQLTEIELMEFLFLSGFTTKNEVTEVSGRGVGLDVVQSMIQAVGGTVRVTTKVGQGTTFTLLLPITMSVIRALLVRVGGEPYAFPLSRIDRILSLEAESIEMIEGRQFFRMDDQSVGLVSAAHVLERPAMAPQGGLLPIVVVSDRGHCFGVIVDEFLGERDLDVRPLDTRLGKVPNINSASVLEDGWPVLIIDVEDLVRSIDNLLGGRRLQAFDGRSDTVVRPETRAAKRILVVDDSITVRELERQLLEGRGFEVDVAVDGMDGWNSVRSSPYDLIVSDVDMPRMDGIQLVTLIKLDPRLKSIPVVIVSYKDRPEDRLRGLEAGADSYLTKSSFHDETFLTTVVDLIGEANEP